MSPQQAYTLVYAPITREHLQYIKRKYYSLIQRAIATQLEYEPFEETRNRKPLKRPVFAAATWELRCGPDNRFRVFYDVVPDAREVHILAIGFKEREKIIIGGKEIDR